MYKENQANKVINSLAKISSYNTVAVFINHLNIYYDVYVGTELTVKELRPAFYCHWSH